MKGIAARELHALRFGETPVAASSQSTRLAAKLERLRAHAAERIQGVEQSRVGRGIRQALLRMRSLRTQERFACGEPGGKRCECERAEGWGWGEGSRE